MSTCHCSLTAVVTLTVLELKRLHDRYKLSPHHLVLSDGIGRTWAEIQREKRSKRARERGRSKTFSAKIDRLYLTSKFRVGRWGASTLESILHTIIDRYLLPDLGPALTLSEKDVEDVQAQLNMTSRRRKSPGWRASGGGGGKLTPSTPSASEETGEIFSELFNVTALCPPLRALLQC